MIESDEFGNTTLMTLCLNQYLEDVLYELALLELRNQPKNSNSSLDDPSVPRHHKICQCGFKIQLNSDN